MNQDFAVYESKHGFGLFIIKYEDEKITCIEIVNEKFSNFGNKTKLTDKVFLQLEEYFIGKRKKFDFQYKLKGTDFQKKVWKALCDIPYGETRSYKDIAEAVGSPKAYRAVGMANNKNPIIIAVPCHRVIGANGKLVGYAEGLDVKEKLLLIEKDNK